MSNLKALRTYELHSLLIGIVPTKEPKDLQCKTLGPTNVYLSWEHLPSNFWHGARANYVVQYKIFDSGNKWTTLHVSSQVSHHNLDDLNTFSRYEVKLAARTRAGVGPSSWTNCMTAEGGKSERNMTFHATSLTFRSDCFCHQKKIIMYPVFCLFAIHFNTFTYVSWTMKAFPQVLWPHSCWKSSEMISSNLK